jgi:hypothetical protein
VLIKKITDWIQVQNPNKKDSYGDSNGAVREWREMIATGNPKAEDVFELALKHNVLAGKWMLFFGDEGSMYTLTEEGMRRRG